MFYFLYTNLGKDESDSNGDIDGMQFYDFTPLVYST